MSDQAENAYEAYKDEFSDDSEQHPLDVVQLTFALFSQKLYGMVQIFFNRRHYQSNRINVAVDVDETLFQTNPEIPWVEFEQIIIEQLTRKNFNYNLSNEVKRKIDESVNYQNYEQFAEVLQKTEQQVKNGTGEQSDTPLALFFTDFFHKIYSDPKSKVITWWSSISEDEFQNRADESEVVLYGTEEEMSEAGQEYTPTPPKRQGELVIAPVIGKPVTKLEPGDEVYIRVYEEASYDRPGKIDMTQQAGRIATITHDNLYGHTITVELAPGDRCQIVEAEDVKVKCVSGTQEGFLSHMMVFYLFGFIMLFILLFFVLR